MTRFLHLAIFALALFVTLLLWYAVVATGAVVAVLAAVVALIVTAAWGVYITVDMVYELDHRRGQSELVWRQAERVWRFEEETGQDMDGDGVIGRPTKPRDSALQQVAAVLEWAYDNATNFGQDKGRSRWGAQYDWAMPILAAKGLIDGRTKGAMGWLVFPDYEQARAALLARWTPHADYVPNAAWPGAKTG